MKFNIAVGTLAASLLIAADASATDNRLGLDFGLFAESDNTVLTPVIDGRFSLSDRTALAVEIPFTAVDAPGDALLVRLANPYVGLNWNLDLEVVNLTLGAGVAIPASRLPTGAANLRQAATAFDFAASSRGRYDAWLWAPEALSLVLPAELDVDLGLLVVRADAALAVLFPTGGADTETIAQLGGEGLVSLLGLLSVGARLQTAWQPTATGETAQVSAGPVVELGLGPISARTMFIFNIEGPAGTSFSSGAFWGWQLGVRVEF